MALSEADVLALLKKPHGVYLEAGDPSVEEAVDGFWESVLGEPEKPMYPSLRNVSSCPVGHWSDYLASTSPALRYDGDGIKYIDFTLPGMQLTRRRSRAGPQKNGVFSTDGAWKIVAGGRKLPEVSAACKWFNTEAECNRATLMMAVEVVKRLGELGGQLESLVVPGGGKRQKPCDVVAAAEKDVGKVLGRMADPDVKPSPKRRRLNK